MFTVQNLLQIIVKQNHGVIESLEDLSKYGIWGVNQVSCNASDRVIVIKWFIFAGQSLFAEFHFIVVHFWILQS